MDASGDAEITFSRSVGIRFCKGRLEYKGEIFFDYNKDTLRNDEETTTTLKNWAEFLRRHPKLRITIEGHTDSRGDDRLVNRPLSQRRANRIAEWLIDRGKVSTDQLEKPVGKGEEGTERPEDEGGEGPRCYNKEPASCHDKETTDDTCECKAAWARSRRAVFVPSEGKDTLVEDCEPVGSVGKPEAAAPPVQPEPEIADCREHLVGFHLNLGGPNQYVGAAAAWQPRCWLELSAGVGYKQGDVSGDRESGSYKAWSVPAKARFWLLRKHSLIFDLGVGFTRINVKVDTPPPGTDGSPAYDRGFAFVGLGYGYRSEGPFRLALLGGVAVMPSDVGRFGALSDPKPYPELSLGFLW